MVPERNVDPADLYDRERLAFVSFIRDLPPERLAVTVPATPDWSVREVVAHVVGITADLNAQRFGDGDSDAWTAAQVARRRDASVGDLAAEWEREASAFEAGLRLFGYWFGAHFLGDLVQHIGDVHGALGGSSRRDDEHLAVALDFYLQSFEEALDAADVGAVEVRAGDERWRLGAGDPVASVAASRYELLRALGGRRTRDEIRGLAWVGDVEAVAPFVSQYPVPATTLGEP